MKLRGASWLEDTSQAIPHFRMLELSGRWDEFWDQPLGASVQGNPGPRERDVEGMMEALALAPNVGVSAA